MSTQTYRVPHVGCERGLRAISAELTKVPRVAAVDVDLAPRTVAVRHDGSVSDADRRAGIEEAGHDVA